MARLAHLEPLAAPAPADDGIPMPFQGAWAREGGHCTDGNVQMEGMLTVWTILYNVPSRYHWMLQFYLRAHGIAVRDIEAVAVAVRLS